MKRAKHVRPASRRRVAGEHEREFISERNYSENFLKRFDKAVEDLRAAAGVERGSARTKYTHATRDVKDELTRVRRGVRRVGRADGRGVHGSPIGPRRVASGESRAGEDRPAEKAEVLR